MKQIFILLFSFLLCGNLVYSQNSVTDAGNIKSVSRNGQEMNIRTQNAFVKVTVYSANVIRVRMDRKPLTSDFSYAVVASPEKVSVILKENEQTISLQTDSLVLIMGKKPLSFSFQTKDILY